MPPSTSSGVRTRSVSGPPHTSLGRTAGADARCLGSRLNAVRSVLWRAMTQCQASAIVSREAAPGSRKEAAIQVPGREPKLTCLSWSKETGI